MIENIWKRAYLHKIELGFAISGLLGLVLLGFSFGSDSVTKIEVQEVQAPAILQPEATSSAEILVDVSGAVKSPGLYSMQDGSRLGDLLKKANGLDVSAHIDYFYRNYNLARILHDQEKIYVPRIDEVVDGVFVEGVYTIEHSLSRTPVAQESTSNTEQVSSTQSEFTNLNTASQAELEELSGIGPVTAGKIINARPIESLDSLVEDKVMSESVLDSIRDEITL